MEGIAVAHVAFDPVEQPVEFQPAEELPIARRALMLDLGADMDRPQQDGLRERDVVAVDQPLGGQVVESQQAVLVAQVGEERGRHFFRLEIQLGGDSLDDLIAAEVIAVRRRAGPGGAHLEAIVGGGREDLLAQLFRGDIRDDLEFGSILEDLGEPAIDLRGLAAAAEELVDLAFDLRRASCRFPRGTTAAGSRPLRARARPCGPGKAGSRAAW